VDFKKIIDGFAKVDLLYLIPPNLNKIHFYEKWFSLNSTHCGTPIVPGGRQLVEGMLL
jgi:hypothetical protein